MLSKKAELSNQTLGILLVAAIALSLTGTFISVTKVAEQPTIKLIGYTIEQNTSQAIINLTIDQVLDINFTKNSLDWGIGSVTPGWVNCTLRTDGGGSNMQGCAGGFVELTATQLYLENIGNQNVTVNLSFNNNATTFIGGTSPGFEFMWVSADDAACRNTTGASMGWTDTSGNASDHNIVNSVGGNLLQSTLAMVNITNDYVICPNMDYAEASDILGIIINVVIPEDSFSGNLSTTLTATAYVIDCQLDGSC